MSSPGQDRNCHDIKAIRIQYNPINNELFCNTVLRCYRAKTQLRPYKAYAIFRHNTISVDLLIKVYNLIGDLMIGTYGICSKVYRSLCAATRGRSLRIGSVVHPYGWRFVRVTGMVWGMVWGELGLVILGWLYSNFLWLFCEFFIALCGKM